MTNGFPTKSLQIVNLVAILDLKIFTNVKNEYLDYQYFIGYFQNAFVSILFSPWGLSKPNMNDFWSVHLWKISLRIGQKMHKITHNSMKNTGSTAILRNLVGVHQRNIHTKFEANPSSGSRKEVKNGYIVIYSFTL